MDIPVKELAYSYRYLPPDDEIDIFELSRKLWAQRLTIFTITTVVTLLAVVVAFLIPPVWQAETRAYRGSQANLVQIHSLKNVLSSQNGSGDVQNISNMTPEQAFQLFYRYLSSPAILRSVFHKSGLSEQAISEAGLSGSSDRMSSIALAEGFEAFEENLSIDLSGTTAQDSGFITIKYSSRNQQFSADLINNYLLPTANAEALIEVKANIASDIEKEKNLIIRQIYDIENEFIKNTAIDKTKLIYAMAQAKSDNIDSFSAQSISDISSINDSNRFVIGWKILSKQLEQANMKLEQYRFLSRTVNGDKDRSLLPCVVSLYDRLERLEQYAVNVDSVKLVTIDEPALVPALPVKPKKVLIVALGAVTGGGLGIFIALIRIANANRKERAATQDLVLAERS